MARTLLIVGRDDDRDPMATFVGAYIRFSAAMHTMPSRYVVGAEDADRSLFPWWLPCWPDLVAEHDGIVFVVPDSEDWPRFLAVSRRLIESVPAGMPVWLAHSPNRLPPTAAFMVLLAAKGAVLVPPLAWDISQSMPLADLSRHALGFFNACFEFQRRRTPAGL